MPVFGLELIFYIIAGAGVGLAVGFTGVGGGSLMTPILILFGIPPKTAIGTDLLYAALTKSGALVSHHRQGNIRWKVVGLICAGSIPASLLTSFLLKQWMEDRFDYEPVLTCILGIMLILTAFVVFLRTWLNRRASRQAAKLGQSNPALAVDKLQEKIGTTKALITVIVGVVLGVLVTLTSVGAGAIGAALLMTLFPLLPSSRIVGTDIAHAVPLTFVAGMGHLYNQNVDFVLLTGLLIGSLPAVHIASSYSKKVSNELLRLILAVILLIIGGKLIWSLCF